MNQISPVIGLIYIEVLTRDQIQLLFKYRCEDLEIEYKEK